MVLGIVILLLDSLGCIQIASSWHESDSLQTGPYVDEIIFQIIEHPDDRFLALQAGEIDMDLDFFHPIHLPNIWELDIDIFSSLRNGYGQITINCQRYPLSISGFRRAFAFAFDKTRITAEIMDGFSQEHDSLVPFVNSWCVENQFDWHYYTNQSDIGNQILDDLNFTINPSTGFRLAPNGDPFEVVILYSSASSEIAGGSAQIGVDALHSLHIDARREEYLYEDISGGAYDMILYTIDFDDYNIDWLAHEYWSENADDYYWNIARFENDTYDNWRNQLLYGTTYEEVYEAAKAMQEILHYNVPRLVVYEDTYLQRYRNDQFTGHVGDLRKYITGPWTMRKIHKIDGTFGGTVTIGMAEEPESFNIFLQVSDYSLAIVDNLYPSLYDYGPDMVPVQDLAESMVIETHMDNQNVPLGHTRFTFDIVHNATWSDGTPLTAEDVVFTFTYDYERAQYMTPIPRFIGNLTSAYAPTTYRVIIEFDTESYWYFNYCGFTYILPQHIFNNETGIGYQGWNTWNPVFDPEEPNVNCGPYTFSNYEVGEFYTIKRNPNFYYSTFSIDSSTTTNSSSTTNQTNDSFPLNWSYAVSITLASGSTIVIIYCTVAIIRKRKEESILLHTKELNQ